MKTSRRNPFAAFAATLTFAAAAAAQTTGVAGINDYTINGSVPGSQSCTSLCLPSPTVLTMSVNTIPGTAVIVVWTDCPCRGCAIPWPANSCAPSIPNGIIPACLTTNQSIDFFPVPGCSILFQATLIANAAGVASMTVTVPPLSAGTVPCGPNTRLTSQAVVIAPCGVGGLPLGPGPFVLSQAYDVGF